VCTHTTTATATKTPELIGEILDFMAEAGEVKDKPAIFLCVSES
jgi:hypothetical protein